MLRKVVGRQPFYSVVTNALEEINSWIMVSRKFISFQCSALQGIL